LADFLPRGLSILSSKEHNIKTAKETNLRTRESREEIDRSKKAWNQGNNTKTL